MKLHFEQVFPHEEKKINIIYRIIKSCGEQMFKEQGLDHWKTPYPIDSIEKNCEEREVFLVKDTDSDTYVHTFQLEFSDDDSNNCIAIINKFATLPTFAGMGIGKQSMNYIDNYCRSKGVSKLCLDVYVKSIHATTFYKKRGFKVIGTKPTRNFTVYLMEKKL